LLRSARNDINCVCVWVDWSGCTRLKKMGSYIALDIELEAIKSFLDKTLTTVDTEIAVICAQEEAGEFRNGIDDFANALFNPMQQEKIAIKAVFYEINALVEWELQNLASEAYHNSNRITKTPKSLLDVPMDQISRIKLIWDLPFREICRLIEEHYEIKLCEAPGFNEIQGMRNTVNAFKHRKGFKDFRKDPKGKLLEEFKPSREEAYKVISEARTFLRAMWGKLKP
jgi:hypothetical protein